MEARIRGAQEHANKLGKNISKHSFNVYISQIRRSYDPKAEIAFHRQKMERHLNSAEKNAKKGTREDMETYIRMAQEHANKSNTNISKHISQIRRSYEPKAEIAFHRQKMEKYLNSAEENAKKGNREDMEARIRIAQHHADKAGQDITDRVKKITTYINRYNQKNRTT